MSETTNWFHEVHKVHRSFGMSIKETLYHQRSKYQDILIFENEDFGTVMALDGCYMLSDLDEHMYHRALTTYGVQNLFNIAHSAQSCVTLAPHDPHLPHVNSSRSELTSLALNGMDDVGSKSNDTKLNILVVGAGDGGIVRDLVRNWSKQIQKVTMVEIDADVIEVSKKFFPNIACEFDNPKLDLRVQDALAFIKSAPAGSYDLVLCDSTDPEGFAAGLIEEDFYLDIKRVMKADGIFCAQSGSPIFMQDELEKTQRNLAKVFAEQHTYYAPMLVYPGTIWSYTAAGAKILNRTNLDLNEFIVKQKQKAHA